MAATLFKNHFFSYKKTLPIPLVTVMLFEIQPGNGIGSKGVI